MGSITFKLDHKEYSLTLSDPMIIYSGAPQGGVISPILF